MKSKAIYDVVVLGAGAAGLMCALTAGQRGRKVLLLEASNKAGKKILMSGGGRCNFTNLEIEAANFLCDNRHFVKSALSQYTQWDFIALVAKHAVAYHEKSLGQLFCDNSSKDILKILLDECRAGDVEIRLDCNIIEVQDCNVTEVQDCNVTEVQDCKGESGFDITSSEGHFQAQSLVVATGGLSIPSLGGATGFGYQLAAQFGLQVHNTEASLVPLTLSGKWRDFSAELSGVSLAVEASVPTKGFMENMLFTHRGLSGPAILQLSNYWHLGDTISIDLLPSQDLARLLMVNKEDSPRSTVSSVLTQYLPKSLVMALQAQWWRDAHLQDFKNAELQGIAEKIHAWQLKPSGTEGYRTAEVTRGGVDVSNISSQTMQVKGHEGLFFIGEVLDVTGHLGGYNFQWAWSSGYVAGINV